jgi:HMG box factor
MATLWRGIVGPDLTVYVRALDLRGGGTAAAAAAAAAGGAGDREAAEEEMVRYGGVECRWDVGAVVVRVGVGGGGGGAVRGSGEVGREGGAEEKTLRRLGFEVLEWVRGGMGGGGGGGGGRAGFGKGLSRVA